MAIRYYGVEVSCDVCHNRADSAPMELPAPPEVIRRKFSYEHVNGLDMCLDCQRRAREAFVAGGANDGE